MGTGNLLSGVKVKILIVSDLSKNHINGVMRTFGSIESEIKKIQTYEIITLESFPFKKKKLIGYEQIELAMNPWLIKDRLINRMNEGYKIHIATEGPIGLYARLYLQIKQYNFSTSYHTMYPEFFKKRIKIPTFLTYPIFKWFHNKSKCVMVPTKMIKSKLENKGFRNIKVWTRGVDTELFNPSKKLNITDAYILCVSRISCEKGLDDFCCLPYPRKILVGKGPYLETLKKRYKDVEFLGEKEGEELAELYASANAFIFPSKTDTFGIVLLEAIASGCPIITYPEPGPLEVIKNHINGIIVNDLKDGLPLINYFKREDVVETSKEWTWKKSANIFLSYL